MKLTVLVDNTTLIDEKYFIAEPAFSIFIEEEKTNVLFDTGYSDAFINNAQKMGIDLSNIDYLVLSHGHLDHTWGLGHLVKNALMNKTNNGSKPYLISHPLVFNKKVVKDDEGIGINISKELCNKYFGLRLSKEPVWLTNKLVYLGEIPRLNNFEGKKSIGKVENKGEYKADYIVDDSALAYKSPEGVVIITGCSHSGICNITEYARKVCKEDKVSDIIGGFHLLKPSKRQIEGTIKYLKKISPKVLHPCHCIDLESKIEISKVVKIGEVGVGITLGYNQYQSLKRRKRSV